MFWCRKDHGGDCLKTLKKLLGRGGVEVELTSGLLFIDEVVRVEGELAPVAVFASERRVAISDIERVAEVA